MDITIKTFGDSGMNFTVQVNPSDNVATLKEQICKSQDIPVDQQVLIFCKNILENESILTQYNIQKNSTVHLALKTRKVDVTVKLMRSTETVQLKLDSMEQSTVIDVKEKLQEEWKILPQDQTLMHKGIKLPDDYRLPDCGVVEESELELVASAHSGIDIEVKISEEFVTFNKFSEAMTVKTAKFKFSKTLNIPPYQQRLLCGEEKLKDHLTLSHYKELNIPGWPSLQLIKKTTVYINIPNQDGSKKRSIVFNVINKRISHIKKKIEKSEDIPYDNQVLVYDAEKLEENKSLDDYNIDSFDELELVRSEKMTIHIQTIHSMQMRDYEMRNTDTVADVKKRLQEDTGIKATKLVLISGGVELRDNCLLFNCSEYSCQHTTLQLMLPMTDMKVCPSVLLINISILSSKETVWLQLGPNDTVEMVKRKIEQQLSIPCGEQKLIYAGLVLKDEQQLLQYNIQKSSTLQLLRSSSSGGKLPMSPDRQCNRDPTADQLDVSDAPSTMDILYELNPELQQHIDFDTLLPYMNRHKILTSEERNFLRNERNQQRVSKLLGYLEKKNEETIDDFVRALSEERSHSGHTELCRLLKKHGITFT